MFSTNSYGVGGGDANLTPQEVLLITSHLLGWPLPERQTTSVGGTQSHQKPHAFYYQEQQMEAPLWEKVSQLLRRLNNRVIT